MFGARDKKVPGCSKFRHLTGRLIRSSSSTSWRRASRSLASETVEDLALGRPDDRKGPLPDTEEAASALEVEEGGVEMQASLKPNHNARLHNSHWVATDDCRCISLGLCLCPFSRSLHSEPLSLPYRADADLSASETKVAVQTEPPLNDLSRS